MHKNIVPINIGVFTYTENVETTSVCQQVIDISPERYLSSKNFPSYI